VRSLGVVVVGTGFGCVTHVRALRAAGFDVKALVGRDPARTSDRAQRFGVSAACTSLNEALAIAGVDAVTVATPPHTHAPLVLEALTAGKHVLCEKPFARDAAEARTVLAAAEQAGVVHLLGTEFRWDAGQATLARTVARGAIGEPRLALVLLDVPMLAEEGAEVPAWWADAASGGGWLGAHGSQLIDQLRVTLGEFEGVSAALPHVAGRDQSAEDAFIVKFRMRSGCTGVMSSSCTDPGPFLIETRVVGSTGTAWIEDVGDNVFVADANGTRQVPVGNDLPRFGPDGPEPLPPGVLHTAYDRMIAHGLDLPPYTRLCETFRDLILDHPIPPEPKPATFADGVAQMEVLDAIRRSAATHEWVVV
jgi:predicted dehydrogenase